MRIIFVPQFPTQMRYAEWWFTKLPEEFRKLGHEVVVLGEKYSDVIKYRRTSLHSLDMFSPINAAIELETEQVKEYMLFDLKDDDILFLADLSFPGIFGTALFHKRPKKRYCFCHATSINRLDYFEKYNTEKFMIETAFANSFDKVFIGSEYHKVKLGWANTVVTYLPFPPFEPIVNQRKKYNIMSASRPNPQKVDLKLESKIEDTFGAIYRPVSNSWGEYFKNLSESKILLITSFEDTFGYQIIDAVLNGCIPIAKNGLSYPEILPSHYLYNDEYELFGMIDYILNSGEKVQIPEILCENQMNNFYKRIISEMEE